MAKMQKGGSKNLPITSSEEIRHLVGDVGDHTLIEILGVSPTIEDLEVAVAYAQGEQEMGGPAELALTGKRAKLYEILTADDAYGFDER